MPNWCENDLTITGPSATLTNISALLGLKKDPPEFDFNQVLPYPKKYADQDALAEEARKTKNDFTVKDGYNNGGYTWCIDNWGTKWNVEKEVQVKSLNPSIRLSFSTAWAPPEGIIRALAEKFPTCKISLRYFECGMQFKGRLVLKDGETLEDETFAYKGNRGG